MKVGYQTICSKYGPIPELEACFALPIAAGLLGHIDFGIYSFVSCYFLMEELEKRLPPYLRSRSIGVTRGSKIMRRAQVGTWALCIAFGVGAEGLLNAARTEIKQMKAQPSRELIVKPAPHPARFAR